MRIGYAGFRDATNQVPSFESPWIRVPNPLDLGPKLENQIHKNMESEVRTGVSLWLKP